MDEIMALARQLGNRIAAHPRTRAFAEAANAVSQDAQARRVLGEFQSASAAMQSQESQGNPPSDNDRKRLSELESQLASNDKLKTMMRSQADYVELMHRVNDAIDRGSQEVLSQGGQAT